MVTERNTGAKTTEGWTIGRPIARPAAARPDLGRPSGAPRPRSPVRFVGVEAEAGPAPSTGEAGPTAFPRGTPRSLPRLASRLRASATRLASRRPAVGSAAAVAVVLALTGLWASTHGAGSHHATMIAEAQAAQAEAPPWQPPSTVPPPSVPVSDRPTRVASVAAHLPESGASARDALAAIPTGVVLPGLPATPAIGSTDVAGAPGTTRLAQLVCKSDASPEGVTTLSAAVWRDARSYSSAMAKAAVWTGHRNAMMLLRPNGRPDAQHDGKLVTLAFDEPDHQLPNADDPRAKAWITMARSDVADVNLPACTLRFVGG